MKIDLNDPHLTAYALGELAESDRQAFETELAGDPAARQEVERIQRAAGNLKEQLAAEPCPRLEPEQRNVIYEKVEGVGGRGSSRATARREARPPVFRWWIGLIAGGATVALITLLILPALKTEQRAAKSMVGTLAVNTAPPAASGKEEVTKTLRESKILFNAAQYDTAEKHAQKVLLKEPDNQDAQELLKEIAQARQSPDLNASEAARARAFWKVDDTWLPPQTQIPSAPPVKGPGGIPTVAGTTPSEYKSSISSVDSLTIDKQSAEVIGIVSDSATAMARLQSQSSSRLAPSRGFTLPDLEYTGPTVSSGGTAGRGAGGVSGPPAATQWNNSGAIAGKPTGGGFYSGRQRGEIQRGPGYLDDGRLNAPTDEESKVPYLADTAVLGRLFRSKDATPSGESYAPVYDNPFYTVADQPLSTFGLDVDTASYSNIRRFLLNNQLPPRNAVRIEEMLNYFTYDYPAPRGNEPFSLYVEMGECPWNPAHQLALVGLKAKDVTARQQPALNLVFLIDVSGSMSDANKLPLIKQAFHLLVPQLDARDRVAIVVYANNARVALPSTRGDDPRRILSVIDELNADGGTNGGEGIQNAYAQASENFIKGGINRVILCTDGDFNVGITDQSELTRLITDKAKSGVFLNVFGFGMGNLKDSTMQKLANTGNGHYAYLDDLDEARKVLVDQARSTIITVAKDVKLQVEFNPAQVQAYRLIGYEKRQLAARDFNNDKKDAGEMDAGHTVTALYEIVPAGEAVGEPGVDPLKYQPAKNRPAVAGEWATVKLRYKNPDADKSQLLSTALKNSGLRWRTASDDFQFAAAVATFGMILRDSGYKGDSSLDLALELAQAGRGRDVKGYRTEFADLVKRAASINR